MSDQVNLEKPKSWNRRMAEQLAAVAGDAERLPADFIEVALEAAGEMKAIRLKVLLGRCYEVLAESDHTQEQAHPEEEFLAEVLDATR